MNSRPLADRIRPESVDDIVGQHHLFDHGKPLRRMIQNGYIPNLIFYGPPGVGKTTAAQIISSKTCRVLKKLNGTTAGTSDIKDVVSELGTFSAPNGILLYLDEIQYLNKKQQQTLLEFIENGKITLVASTTENPYFYVYGALLSRSTVFEFKPVDQDDIKIALDKGVAFLERELKCKIIVDGQVLLIIARQSCGDVRRALNVLESSVMASERDGDKIIVSDDTVKNVTEAQRFYYDKNSDEHYDTISAFQKSMRGSDPDAAIYYLARLIVSQDLISICRRLLVCACEDVGLAYPQIIPIVKACTDIAMQVGLPEARIPLADAVLLVCNAPKSNSAYRAINTAVDDVNHGCVYDIPRHLKNKHCDGSDVKVKGQFYKYPHDFPHNFIEQTYLPSQIQDKKYYFSGDNKFEKSFETYWEKIKDK